MGRNPRISGDPGKEGGALSAVTSILDRVAIAAYGGRFPNEYAKRYHMDFLMTALTKMTDEETAFLRDWLGRDE